MPLLQRSRRYAACAKRSNLAPTPRAQRVLVVDDNRDAADMLAMFLELDGHEVRVAFDGTAAIPSAEAFRPDVAIIDIGMPGMDGYEVAAALRAQPWTTSLTLVALTGWGQNADRAHALRNGFDRHVTKPVDPALLKELLVVPRAASRQWSL